jgi:F0F1-type ATP synthase membrane subunit c/vacuolar-type H+-ATPase subunit K
MNTRLKDRIALGSAITMGLGMSTGYPLGMMAAAGMPVACLAPGTRKSTFQNAFCYYVAALWPMVSGLERYIGRSGTFVMPLALWIFAAVLLSLPWALAATSNRLQCLWRTPLALLATVIPPLGVIGLASPLTAAGYLFPGARWVGVAAVALLPGILLSAQVLAFRRRCVVRCFVIALCVGSAIGGCWFHSGDAPSPRGWVAVNTEFGDVSQPFRDFLAAQFIQQKAAESSARVLIFPEAVVPRWSEATEAFWHASLDRCRSHGQILAIGAELPARRTGGECDLQKFTDLRLYDFGPAIDALRTMDTKRLHTIQPKPRPEPTDNAMLVVGAESATFYQRVPVPVGMWQPFSRTSVPLRLTAPGILAIDHQRAAVLICYEQMLTFPFLASMFHHPTVIVGISNTFWVDGTPIPRYQAAALRGWARLFRLPYLLAVNS